MNIITDLSATLQALITFYTLLSLYIVLIGWKKLYKKIDSSKPEFLTLAIHQKEESYILTGFSLTALSIFLSFKIRISSGFCACKAFCMIWLY